MAVDPDLSTRLVEAVKLQSMAEPDMYLVGKEGTKIPGHRSVMSLFSPFIRSLLNTSPQHLVTCVVIPESSYASLASMVAIFYSGLVPSNPDDEEAVANIEDTCKLLGFRVDLQSKLNASGNDDKNIDSEKINQYKDLDDKCDGQDVVQNRLEKKEEKIETIYKCEKCEYCSENPTYLLKHYAVDHFDANISQLTDFYFQLNSSTGSYDPCKVCNKAIPPITLEKNTHKVVVKHIGVNHMKILDILRTNKIEIPHLYGSKTKKDISSISLTNRCTSEEFQCGLCIVSTFSTRTAFQDHLSGVHFVEELVGEYGNMYSKACSLCKFKFQTVQQLAKHIGTIHDKVMANYQQKLKESNVEGSNIEKSTLSCSFNCEEEISDQIILKKHYISNHFADELVRKFGSYESQCSLCFAWLNSKVELAMHIGDFHGKVNEMIRMPMMDDKRQGSANDEDLSPVVGRHQMNEEVLAKKMIEKSKKLFTDRNLQMSNFANNGGKTVNITMSR